MSRKTKPKRLGQVAFFIPIVAVILLAIFGLYSFAFSSSGTLVVEAQAQGGATSQFVAVTATVSSVTRVTPFNITVAPGGYTVTYPPLNWYSTPSPRYVNVEGGKVAYSIGVYVPVPVEVTISQFGPNSTAIAVEHGVTPIIWFNNTNQAIEVQSVAFAHTIQPGGNYTIVVKDAGSLRVSLLPSGAQVSVTVE